MLYSIYTVGSFPQSGPEVGPLNALSLGLLPCLRGPFCKPFEEEVHAWEATLMYIQDFIDQVIALQRPIIVR